MTHGTAYAASMTPPAPPPMAPPQPVVRSASDPSGAFAGVAALASAFAGLMQYSHEPALLPTALAAGITFLGALVALHVLHFVFRVAVALGKFAIPAAAILLIGCALDWPWAETAVDFIATSWTRGVDAAQQGLAAWQAR